MGLFDIFKKKKSVTDLMYLYTENDINTYEKFIKEQFGEYENVLHEIFSPNIHLDIIVIPPTQSHNYYKLITMGMGAYKMKVSNALKRRALERAELVLYLPPTWNISSNKEEDYWPIRQLKVLARLPIEANTWLGYGHTVSSDAENTSYADNTKFCSIMLLPALNKKLEKLNLILKSGKINFYQIFPLYKEELEYKLKTDTNALLELFEDESIVPIINIDRKNHCIK